MRGASGKANGLQGIKSRLHTRHEARQTIRIFLRLAVMAAHASNPSPPHLWHPSRSLPLHRLPFSSDAQKNRRKTEHPLAPPPPSCRLTVAFCDELLDSNSDVSWRDPHHPTHEHSLNQAAPHDARARVHGYAMTRTCPSTLAPFNPSPRAHPRPTNNRWLVVVWWKPPPSVSLSQRSRF